MLRIPLKYNVRNLAVRRTASLMTAVGIALPTGVFCSVLALRNGLTETLRETGSSDTIVFLRRSSMSETNSTISPEEASVVETLTGIRSEPSSGLLMASRELIVLMNLPRRGSGGKSNVAIRGMTPVGRLLRPAVKLVEGRWPEEGLAELAVARGIAARFEGCTLGSHPRLAKREFEVVGVFDAGPTAYESEIWGDSSAIATEFRREGWSAVWVGLTPGEPRSAKEWEQEGRLRRAHRPALSEKEDLSLADDSMLSASGLDLLRAARLDARLKTLEGFTERDYFRQQTRTGNPIAGIGAFISLFMAIGAAFAVMNTMYAAVAGRNQEIAVMRAIGFHRRSILTSFLLESLLLAIFGSALGALGSFVVNGVSTGTVNFVTLSEMTFAFRVSGEVLADGLVFGTILGVLGGLLPAIRAARQPVVGAMRAV
jgi:putative ABC transport system permease protein